MRVVVLVVAIIISIGISIFRAKNIVKRREEEKRQHAEKTKRLHEEYDELQDSPRSVSAENAAPEETKPAIPNFGDDPFAAYRTENTGTLSPAQYNEWLLDFISAERAAYPRPPRSAEIVPFARYLQQAEFCLADLYKTEAATKLFMLPEKAGESEDIQRAHRMPLPVKEEDTDFIFTSFYKDKN